MSKITRETICVLFQDSINFFFSSPDNAKKYKDLGKEVSIAISKRMMDRIDQYIENKLKSYTPQSDHVAPAHHERL